MLEKEFKYYLDHQKELVEKYNSKYIVIKGDTVSGGYLTQQEAYKEAIKSYELGTFLIQLVSPGTEAYTITYHSRVRFA
jgi:hypothetical protein